MATSVLRGRLARRCAALALALAVVVLIVDVSTLSARDTGSQRPAPGVPQVPPQPAVTEDARQLQLDGCVAGYSCMAQAPGFGGSKAATLKPGIVAVGKWPEGIAGDGTSIWVAESGQRRIARVDTRANRVVETMAVGRLPVDMAVGPGGNIYTLVNTDKTVFVRTPDGKGRKLATLSECPERFAPRAGMLLVLVQPDCSSATSRVLAIDTGSGTVRSSPELGANAVAIAAVGDAAWVVHSTGSIRIVDATSSQHR